MTVMSAMESARTDIDYDCIVVGSGTAGATIARELSGAGQRVLLLERGKHLELKESVWTMVSMFNEARVADKLKDARVFAAGGSSAMYLAMMDEPPIEAYRALGIELADAYAKVRESLPLAELPDALLSPQTLRLRDAALAAGHDWKKKLMLIDQSMCDGTYSYAAKWKALTYVEEAVQMGAKLQCRALAERVLVEDGKAVGVECSVAGAGTVRYRAGKVVLAAGSLATPPLLRKSGLHDAAAGGYYIDPSFVMFGKVPGLKGRDSFACTMGAKLEDGTALLDACVHRLPYNMLMIQVMRLPRLFSYPQHVGIMVKAHDAVGGSLSADGRYHKELDSAVFAKLRGGEDAARRILGCAGATGIFKSSLTTGGTFGTLRIGVDVDTRLETRIGNLHVCDGSLIPENSRVAPTLTLLCLAKYLATVLAKQPDAPTSHRLVSDMASISPPSSSNDRTTP